MSDSNRKMTNWCRSIFAFAVAFLLIPGYIVYANAIPGSSADPLVSQSYVDTKFNELLALINSKTGTGSTGNTGTSPTVSEVTDEVMARLSMLNTESQSFKVISLLAGQTLIGGEGAELILRSGGAQTHCPGADGIADLTAGADIKNGIALTANHHLLFPRSDGRGVLALTDCYFMVKGSYTVH